MTLDQHGMSLLDQARAVRQQLGEVWTALSAAVDLDTLTDGQKSEVYRELAEMAPIPLWMAESLNNGPVTALGDAASTSRDVILDHAGLRHDAHEQDDRGASATHLLSYRQQ
jgi:hypothetical protein